MPQTKIRGSLRYHQTATHCSTAIIGMKAAPARRIAALFELSSGMSRFELWEVIRAAVANREIGRPPPLSPMLGATKASSPIY